MVQHDHMRCVLNLLSPVGLLLVLSGSTCLSGSLVCGPDLQSHVLVKINLLSFLSKHCML
jgi:hypothetical protein